MCQACFYYDTSLILITITIIINYCDDFKIARCNKYSAVYSFYSLLKNSNCFAHFGQTQ